MISVRSTKQAYKEKKGHSMNIVDTIKSEIEIATSQIAEATKGLTMEMSKKDYICEAYVKEKSEAIAKHTQNLAYWKNQKG